MENNNENILKTKNSVYFELFGSAVSFYNISYDRILYTTEKNNVSLGLGAQYLPPSDFITKSIITFSPQINYFYGHKHHIEFGLGCTFDPSFEFLVMTSRIGYRFQKPAGGVFYKIGFTPYYTANTYSGFAIMPWGGLAIGWTF